MARNIKMAIWHCSATIEGKDFKVEDIDSWHKARGFKMPYQVDGKDVHIGYHIVIYLDGTIHWGRPVNAVGANAKGYNLGSIGVCYIGGLDQESKAKDTRTDEQKAAQVEVKKWLDYFHPGIDHKLHNELNLMKACPCHPMDF